MGTVVGLKLESILLTDISRGAEDDEVCGLKPSLDGFMKNKCLLRCGSE